MRFCTESRSNSAVYTHTFNLFWLLLSSSCILAFTFCWSVSSGLYLRASDICFCLYDFRLLNSCYCILRFSFWLLTPPYVMWHKLLLLHHSDICCLMMPSDCSDWVLSVGSTIWLLLFAFCLLLWSFLIVEFWLKKSDCCLLASAFWFLTLTSSAFFFRLLVSTLWLLLSTSVCKRLFFSAEFWLLNSGVNLLLYTSSFRLFAVCLCFCSLLVSGIGLLLLPSGFCYLLLFSQLDSNFCLLVSVFWHLSSLIGF